VDIGADEYMPSGDLTSIHGAKKSAVNSWIEFTGDIVTARFGDVFYIEAENRASGIRVQKPGHTLDRSMKAHVFGKVKTNDDGEVYVEAGLAERNGSETEDVDPLSLPNYYLGGGPFGLQAGLTDGFGLNNIGLLVRTYGAYTAVDQHTFTIDDGSGLNVKCIVPDGVVLGQDWTYVSVTGISACESIDDSIQRLVRIRTQSDIVHY
jgi:hypothetical protein